jgi:uncharacterized phage-associated protein
MYSTKAVANWFLKKHEGELDPMKLQKLVYFAHGWHLGLYDARLVNETVQAWRFGPVFPTVYHEFKEFGPNPIKRKATREKFENGAIVRWVPVIPRDDEDTQAFLEKIDSEYSSLTAVSLSALTHAPGTPWRRVWDEMGGVEIRGKEIPDRIIKQYFRQLAAES